MSKDTESALSPTVQAAIRRSLAQAGDAAVVIIQPDQSLQVVAVDERATALVPLLSEVLRVELRALPDMVAALVRGTLS